MFSDILQAQDYHTSDPIARDVIDEVIRKELSTLGQTDLDSGKGKKGKSSQEQTLTNLKNNSEGKFKYLVGDDNKFDYDYEEEEKAKKDKELELVKPKRFEVLGFSKQSEQGGKIRPVLRISDVYLTSNQRAKKLINKVFESYINGRTEPPKTQQGVLISKSASNAQQLEEIIKNYENQDEDYNIQNQDVNMNEQQLQEYVIDRGQSKTDYFLFYRNQQPKKVNYDIKNHPLKSKHFLKRLHAQVKEKQRQYNVIDDEESQEDQQGEGIQPRKQKRDQDKKKEYFGQFKKNKGQKTQNNIKIQDNFQTLIQNGENLAKSIIDSYSYIDNDILSQQYKKSREQNDKLQLNLSNPFFFQPKLHMILNREKQLLQDSQFKARMAEAAKNNRADKSRFSGQFNNFSKLSNHPSEGIGLNSFTQEENITIEDVINTQIKNISREPLKHSEIATKYQFVKFTLEEDVFNSYHRYHFPFQQHLYNGKVKVELHYHRNRRIKPNGLVINAEMKETNQKFSRKEDLSCAKGEFIFVQFIQETPILMSDVGMCQRMFIQVNYLEVLSRMREEIFNLKSIDDMEEERDKLLTTPISYRKHADHWRKIIKEEFGENGKQFYWEPKQNTGKVIGVPEGLGVIVMQSNLGTVPLVKKKTSKTDYLLVRQGKKWILRKIDNMYISGQVEPSKKIFCPGSRQHTDFKLAYQRAYIVKQIKEYGSVNFDQLKLTFKGETQNSLRKALKTCNAISRDSKNFKIIQQVPTKSEHQLTPEDICLYQRMQKSLCQLKEVGICQIRSNQKMKNVLKVFNKKNFQNDQKITIARVIREQLQLTSWYLTDSFLKFKQKASKIEIKGFADPTNGRGGYSFINKPQKQRTAKQDMQERQEKQKTATDSDLRKLNCDSSRELLRARGHNQDEIQNKGRWQLITMLKGQGGTQYFRKDRETKMMKLQNEKKQISKNFNQLLSWLKDQTQQPSFKYSRTTHNTLQFYLEQEKDYIIKIRKRYGQKNLESVKQEQESDQSDDGEVQQ